MPRHTPGHRFNLGLRWLDAADHNVQRPPAGLSGTDDWEACLAAAEALPVPHRLWIARLWPLSALINGPVALSALMLWPERSGVHMLLFLMVFLLVPWLMLCWIAVRGLVMGRPPWWGALLLRHHDRVIATWCARQSLLLQGLFCVAGLVWLWLMLATRQIIFYWSTSIASISGQIADLFAALSRGLIVAPDLATVSAAEAGAITGWHSALLADSLIWATWLTQVLVCWVLMPCLLLLAVCQWRLQAGIRSWPRYNARLCTSQQPTDKPVLDFRALQPEQPQVERVAADIPVHDGWPQQPGFGWRVTTDLPPGSIRLGERDHAADEAAVKAAGIGLTHWYIASHAVPTGDLADLLHEHCRSGVTPQLTLLLDPVHQSDERLDTLRHSWSVFLHRNALPCAMIFLRSRAPLPVDEEPS